MNLKRTTFAEEPSLRHEIFDAIKVHAWPEFMFHDELAEGLWHHLGDDFAEYQFVLRDGAVLAAVGHMIPFAWREDDELPDAGWNAIFERGVADKLAGRAPNMASALEAAILPAYRGKGVSRQVIGAMYEIARPKGFTRLVAPVRPSEKANYPLTPMSRYVEWTNEAGEPFDAWIRTHWRIGARVVKVAPRSMEIRGSVTEWEQWTGMRFPDSGEYIVPGALTPVTIDRAGDCGEYIEPNVWMVHDI